jgi:flavodoxin short chain
MAETQQKYDYLSNRWKGKMMEKIQVVFWSQGGNTQAMAEAIGQGIKEAGKDAEVVFVSGASIDDLKATKAFALGCPAMGAEELEESEMEPFVCDVERFASGKTIALFGSYGWGDGQWMRDWVERMNTAGATVLNGEGLMSHETPDESVLDECIALGKQLAEL